MSEYLLIQLRHLIEEKDKLLKENIELRQRLKELELKQGLATSKWVRHE